MNAIAAKRARTVLVIGVEKMTEITGPAVGDILIRAAYLKEEGDIEGGFAGVFGRIAQAYFQRYGDQSDALARIAAKNHKNGAANPLAQMQKDLGYEFCRTVSEKNPLVAGPLRRTDCSLVSDGAAALVLTDVETALSCEKAVVFRAAEQVNDYLPMSKRDIVAFEGPALAWQRALAAARVGLDDLSCAEVHDCFTIAELLMMEAMGLEKPGHGVEAVKSGKTQLDGALPVNTGGGLVGFGHPVGATGVKQAAEIFRQMKGRCGDYQLKSAPSLGVMANMGGDDRTCFVGVFENQ
jgi:acetyl-CoA C-acetyltransferase